MSGAGERQGEVGDRRLQREPPFSAQPPAEEQDRRKAEEPEMDELPRTGLPVGLASLLLASGGGALWLSRRR